MPILALALLGFLPLSASYGRQSVQCMPIAGDPGWTTIANTCRACFHEAAANWLLQAPQKQVYTYEGGDAVADQVLDQADQTFLTELNGKRQAYLSNQPGPARAQFAASLPDWAAKKAIGEMHGRRRPIDEFIMANEERGLESKEALSAVTGKELPPEPPPSSAARATTQTPPAPPTQTPPQGAGPTVVPSAAPTATAESSEPKPIPKPTSQQTLDAFKATPGRTVETKPNGDYTVYTTKVADPKDPNSPIIQEQIEANKKGETQRITTQTVTPVDGGVTLDKTVKDLNTGTTQRFTGKGTEHIQGVGLASEGPNGKSTISVMAAQVDPKNPDKILNSYSETLTTNRATGEQVRTKEWTDNTGRPTPPPKRITDSIDQKTGERVHEEVRLDANKQPTTGTVTRTNPLSGLTQKYTISGAKDPVLDGRPYIPRELPSQPAPGAIPPIIQSLAPRQAVASTPTAARQAVTTAATSPWPTTTGSDPESGPTIPGVGAFTASSPSAGSPGGKKSSITPGQAAVLGLAGGAGAGYIVSTMNRPSSQPSQQAAAGGGTSRAPRPTVTTRTDPATGMRTTTTVYRDSTGSVTRTQRVLQGTDAQGNVVRQTETLDADGNVVRGRKTVKDPNTGAVIVYVYRDGNYQVVNSTPTATASPN